MERIKRQRRPIRAAITRVCDKVDDELAKENADPEELRLQLDKLDSLWNDVQELDQRLLDALLDANCTDDEQDEESLSIEEYSDKIRRSRLKINGKLNPPDVLVVPTPSTLGEAAPSVSSSGGGMRSFRLPKIELRKFNGELTEWLGFWSQFSKIHDDEHLDQTDKFQYLVQAMVKGTRARELVESYPQTSENYPKAIAALKERFGDDNLLVEVYTRELLKLVSENAFLRGKIKLSQMYDKLESYLRALETMGCTMHYAYMLYPMVESSLPEDVLRAWIRSPLYSRDGKIEEPPKSKLEFLMEFLRNEIKGEQRITMVQAGFETPKEKKKVSFQTKSFREEVIPTAAGLFIGDKIKCIFCDNAHESRECLKAHDMPLDEKRRVVNDKRCCLVCLRTGHQAKACRGFIKCLICDRRHPTIMCPERSKFKKRDPERMGKESQKPVESATTNLACSSKVIMKTVMVTINSNKGPKTVRAFLDDGSQRSYILKGLAEELNLTSVGTEEIIHTLFSGVRTDVQNHHKYLIELQTARQNDTVVFEVLDQKKICAEIPRLAQGPWIKELKQKRIWISDLGYDNPEIQILIGADVIGNLLTGQIVQLGSGLTAVETVLGWTIMGKTNSGQHNNNDNCAMSVTSLFVAEASIHQLWDLETIGIRDPAECQSKEEKEEATKQHFLDTVTRSENGRYTVSLPWIDGKPMIPNNRNIAEKRLENTTKKLQSEGKFKDYDNIFKAWKDEGIIEEVTGIEIDNQCHYIPHRAVLKPESVTTPIRPVYDASCKAYRSPSLNDCLEKGPNLLELIPYILLRFREKKYGLSGDIRKAFQMVNVKEEDRDYLRFLWWEDPVKKMFKVYRHRRVVFGVNCSPFLLGAVLEYHINNAKPEDTDMARKLLKSLYVDNCVTSEDTLEECLKFKKWATEYLAEAKMELRQWECGTQERSGIGSFINECGLDFGSPNSLHGTKGPSTSILGYKWDKMEDTLSCDFRFDPLPEKVNKRLILSYTQQVYDPIGFACPTTLLPKLQIQKLWEQNKNWDEELPKETREKFGEWCEELSCLQLIRIPRNSTGGISSRCDWQLHTFCDASQDAYAAVVFLRTVSGDGVSVQLLQAKARVAPLKKSTIPRLELLGCTIAARLTHFVKEAMSMKDVPTFLWSDSSTALAWIRRNDSWGTFVGNRVKSICTLTNVEDWRHVPGILNPADLPSRGCSPAQLLASRWWEGPTWLKMSIEEWPSEDSSVDEDEVISEKKKKVVTAMTVTAISKLWYCQKSSFKANVCIVAWMKRFIGFLRVGAKKYKISGPFSTKEIKEAESSLLRMVQQESFPNDEDVIGGVRVQRDKGIVYVKTKLTNRKDKFGFRFPILLPNCHPVVEQIIREMHLKNKHAGVQILMGKLRERYWILQGRRAIRAVVSKCVICRRFTAKRVDVIPAPLPEDRVKSASVFEVTGVDLAGPLYVKGNEKAWIVLFTCAVYRCVHLELVKSLSTEAFMDAFSRFCSIRTRPSIVYSDNGTNFIGADNALKDMDWDRIQREHGIEKIQWKFNPPAAPWWGGWWERLVRSVKDLLRRTLRKTTLTYEKMVTCLYEVTAIINSRPLTVVTEDPEDLIPLTPAMFLNEVPCPFVSDKQLLDASGFRFMYKKRKTLLDELKMRFRREYLALLVQRGKEKNAKKFQVGDIVLVEADNRKRWEWPLARITEIFPGNDGNVRVANVKTAKGVLLRAVQRLYPLELSSAEDVPPPPSKRKQSKIQDKTEVMSTEVRTRVGRLVKSPSRLGQ